jgi:hypothetical protein
MDRHGVHTVRLIGLRVRLSAQIVQTVHVWPSVSSCNRIVGPSVQPACQSRAVVCLGRVSDHVCFAHSGERK